ncbi:MAG: AAA family ATPase [Ruminococcaceae bacterium]|nr:AAA family ATPase [Oscillospiraceae bacterium]
MNQLFNLKKKEKNESENVVEEAVQEMQETVQDNIENDPDYNIDYTSILSTVFSIARNNKDITNFAYYLYKKQIVVENDYNNDKRWISFSQKVNFCDCTKWRSETVVMNYSKLEQLYTTDMFTDCYDYLWERKNNMPQGMFDRCRNCNGSSGENFEFCPYFLCYTIIKAAEVYNITPEKIFSDILGEDKIEFRGKYEVSAVSISAIPAEELYNINAKSAYGAYLLLNSKMIALKSIEDTVVNYSYLSVCRGDKKSNCVSEMIDFWKTGSGISACINVADMTSVLYSKTDGCKKCGFEQCPHKLAAYFSYLGQKYNIDPIDLAYHIANNTTYAGLAVRDNYQFDKFLANVKKAPMKEESKAEFVKMIHFIAGRKVNWSIPFLPFNMIVSSPDKEKAHEIVADFYNALWHFDYFRRGQDNISRIDIYISSLTFDELCAEYKNANPATYFVVHDIHLLCDNDDFKAGYHKLLKIMEDRREAVMSAVIGEKTEISTFFATYPAFASKIFTKTLEMINMDNESVLDALEDKLTKTFTIPEEVRQHLEQYISITYPSSVQQGMVYVDDLYEKLLFNHYNYDVNAGSELRRADIPFVKPPRSEQEIFEEINNLTGLADVKRELKAVNDLVKFNIKMGEGSKNAVNMHMVFTGNPGTGKTTVARLTAEILYSIGFIQENKLVVCSAKDLIGEYTGWTTPKTARKCEQAYNGVLFIDEAYQLNPYTSNQADTFKEECIAELIQQMENNRDKLVVIFAGYTDEMEEFLNRANTGLRSRIGKTIDFPDYSSSELLEIFTNIVERAGLKLSDGAALKALEIFENARKDSQRFGNARYARNLYERSLLQHAAITANLDKNDPELKILKRDEITIPNV